LCGVGGCGFGVSTNSGASCGSTQFQPTFKRQKHHSREEGGGSRETGGSPIPPELNGLGKKGGPVFARDGTRRGGEGGREATIALEAVRWGGATLKEHFFSGEKTRLLTRAEACRVSFMPKPKTRPVPKKPKARTREGLPMIGLLLGQKYTGSEGHREIGDAGRTRRKAHRQAKLFKNIRAFGSKKEKKVVRRGWKNLCGKA